MLYVKLFRGRGWQLSPVPGDISFGRTSVPIPGNVNPWDPDIDELARALDLEDVGLLQVGEWVDDDRDSPEDPDAHEDQQYLAVAWAWFETDDYPHLIATTGALYVLNDAGDTIESV